MHLTFEVSQRWWCRHFHLPHIISPTLFHLVIILGLLLLQQSPMVSALDSQINPADKFSDTDIDEEGGRSDGDLAASESGKFMRFIESDGVWRRHVVEDPGNEIGDGDHERNLLPSPIENSGKEPQELGKTNSKRVVSKRNAREETQDWRLAGLESEALTLDSYDEGGSEGSNRRSNSRNSNCPEDCKCGLVTGVTCYSPSDNAILPQSFPRGIQLLTLYGYKRIANELQDLKELKELSIYDGNLDQIPPLPISLTHLRITNSNLKSLDNANFLPYLQSLNAAHNNITNANLAELSHLLSLDISHNPMTKVPELPTSLTILNLKNTHLNEQPTTWDIYLPNLRQLILSGIQTREPPYLSLPKLEYLDLSHSEIRLLPYLSSLPSLKDINLSRIQINLATPNHFKGPENLQKIDLSNTHLSKLPDKLFIHNPNLKEIYMHNTDIEYIKDYTLAGLSKLEKLIIRDNADLMNIDDISLSTLTNLKTLDLSYTPVRALPISLRNVNLTHFHAENMTLLCDCHSHWVPAYFESIGRTTELTGVFPVRCSDGVSRSLAELEAFIFNQECTAPDIVSPPDVTLRRRVGKTALLECNATGIPYPIIIWHSPDKKYYAYNHTEVQPWFSDKFKYIINHIMPPETSSDYTDDTTLTTSPPGTTFPTTMTSVELTTDPRIRPLKTGQLLIQNLTRADVGLYRCMAVNAVASVTSTTSLWLTVAELEAFKIETLLFGLACAMTFLLTTLIVQLIRYIMDRMGWECCCCRGRISSKAQQVKRLLETVESYKSQQLDKLKDNYNSQVVTIKESCYQQMERLSESYSQQCRNLQSIKDYSAQQLNTARDQYVEQINKVRDYSVGQMNKVSENYVFQRQRIRKFSAHQLFKLRETYKYQQKTLNKILENIPDLYLQNCRTGGNCNRTDSIIFDDEIHGIDAYYRLDFLNPILGSNEGSEDCYYTPSSTLTRNQRQTFIQHHRRQHSGCSTVNSNECYQEAVQSWATNTPNLSPGNSPSHPQGAIVPNKLGLKHTRSMSICAVKPNSKTGYVPSHRRTLSANVNSMVPSSATPPTLARVHHSRTSPPSPLVEKTYWTPMARSPTTDEESGLQAPMVPVPSSSGATVTVPSTSLGYGSSGIGDTGAATKGRSDSDNSDNESAAMLKFRDRRALPGSAKGVNQELQHLECSPKPGPSKKSSYTKLAIKPCDVSSDRSVDSGIHARKNGDPQASLERSKTKNNKKLVKSSSDKSVVPTGSRLRSPTDKMESMGCSVGDLVGVAVGNNSTSASSSDENIHNRKDESIQAIEEKSARCISELVKTTDALVSSVNTRDNNNAGRPIVGSEDQTNGSYSQETSQQVLRPPNTPAAESAIANTIPPSISTDSNQGNLVGANTVPRTSAAPSTVTAEAARRKSLSREGSKELEGRCALPSVNEDREPSSSESNF